MPEQTAPSGAKLSKEENAAARAEKKAVKAARPKMPKWLHVLTVLFALNFVITIASLIFTSRDLVSYNTVNLLDWANIVFEMVLLWMLWCRFKVARPFVLFYSAFNVTVGAAYSIYLGTFDVFSLVFDSLFDIALFLYFLLSKKTRAYLIQPFGIDKESALGETHELRINRRNWAFFRNLIIYYCFFSLAGHWMESAFCMLIRAGIVAGEVDLNNTMLWRDWFYPFPMEGIAVVLIAVLLYPLFIKLREKITIPGIAYAISFVINGLVCVAIEYIMGQFVNADLQLWNYSDMPFNFQGMICLQNGLGFAFAASVICWCVYPLLERWFAKLPKNVMNLAFVVVLVSYAIPQALYLPDSPVPYKDELQTIIENADGIYDDEDIANAQAELDKLIALEEQGVTLAGAPSASGSSSGE